ncbi:hypothetical protein BAMY6639_13110 [Bacillus amyloliquefaciens UMAF6639]|nr:hypothetical protein BAMY6639_13110 [Bacillus amyloliquefaciens UMAF6639]
MTDSIRCLFFVTKSALEFSHLSKILCYDLMEYNFEGIVVHE